MNETPKHTILKTCWEYDIKVYPVPAYGFGDRVKICIEKRGNPKLGEQIYDQFAKGDHKTKRHFPNPELWKEIDKIYQYFFKQITQKKKAA